MGTLIVLEALTQGHEQIHHSLGGVLEKQEENHDLFPQRKIRNAMFLVERAKSSFGLWAYVFMCLHFRDRKKL
jgi:hypothetical protein